MSSARSMIRTGSPISSTNTSPPAASEPGADDELHGLRDRHEEARHVRVGDRHRPARRDLAPEDRHDGARGVEHVAEAHRCVSGVLIARVGGLGGPLRERLGGAHHGRRVDGLVGRDLDEDLRAGVARDARHHARGDRVVAHGLDGVLLHQAHVLVGGRVEDDGRAVLLEHLPHALLLLAVGEHRDGVERVPVLDQLARDLEQVVLGVVEQDEPARPHARDLAAQLGADRAARAGDHHAAAGQVAAGRLDLHPDRLAPQHVLHPHLADLADVAPAAGLEQLEDRRHRAHAHAALAARAHDPRAQGAGGGGDRDQDLVGLDVLEHPRAGPRSCRARRGRGRRARPACADRRRRSRPGASRGRGCAGSRAAAAGRRRRRRRSGPSARRGGRDSRRSGARSTGGPRSARRRGTRARAGRRARARRSGSTPTRTRAGSRRRSPSA